MTPELQIQKKKRDKEISRVQDPLSIKAHQNKRHQAEMSKDFADSGFIEVSPGVWVEQKKK